MHWRRALLAAPILFLAVAVPGVQAALIPAYEFTVHVAPLDLGQNQAPSGEEQGLFGGLNLTLVTGFFNATGERNGLYGFVGVQNGAVHAASRIDVINAQDVSGAQRRALNRQCNSLETCVVEKTFWNPTATLSPNSTFLLHSNATGFNYTAQAPFGIATLLTPPQELAGQAFSNFTLEQSLLVVGDGLKGTGRLLAPSDQVFGYLPLGNSTLLIADANGSAPYAGTQYLFRFYGAPTFDMEATGLVLPFQGRCQATLRPSSAEDLAAHFRLETLNDVVRRFGDQTVVLPPEIERQVRQLSPVLNGVVLGSAAEPLVDEQTLGPVDFALIRFQKITLAPAGAQGVQGDGRSSFVLLGPEGFYTVKSGTQLGPFLVPAFSFVLWFLAAGAIAAGFILRPLFAAPQVGGFGLIRLSGLFFHAFAFVLAFVLWDAEIKRFLGTSLLTLFTEGAFGQYVSLAVAAVFQLVPFALASLLFGMPIRFVINSGLKLGGLKRARGVGKGVGNLATWALGAPFIPLFLNGFIEQVLSAAQTALP